MSKKHFQINHVSQFYVYQVSVQEWQQQMAEKLLKADVKKDEKD